MSQQSISAKDALHQAKLHDAAGNMELSRQIYLKVLSALPIDHALRDQTQSAINHLAKKYLDAESKKELQRLYSLGKLEKAISLAEIHVEKFPEDWSVRDFLGSLLVLNGKQRLAIDHFDIAIQCCPQQASPYSNKATALEELEELEEALATVNIALDINSSHPNANANKGRILLKLRRYQEALECFTTSQQLNPQIESNTVGIAKALYHLGRFDEAIMQTTRVLEKNPNNADANFVRGTALRLLNDMECARKCYELAITLKPEMKNAKPALSQIQFFKGELDKAWDNFETRHQLTQLASCLPGIQRWQGQPLHGKKILVAAEQGFGDQFMWGNYLPFVYDEAKELTIQCDRRVHEIYRRRFPNAELVDYSHDLARFAVEEGADTDYWVSICSLPSSKWHDVENITPHPDGFLSATKKHRKIVKNWLKSISSKPKVAIAWKSGLRSPTRDMQYASLHELEPLWALSDKVDFINLQYGDVRDELKELKQRSGVEIHHPPQADLKNDIEINLALCEAVDFVVSVSIAPAQIALTTGARTFVVSRNIIWWDFGKEKKIRFSKNGEIVSTYGKGQWREIFESVTNKITMEVENGTSAQTPPIF